MSLICTFNVSTTLVTFSFLTEVYTLYTCKHVKHAIHLGLLTRSSLSVISEKEEISDHIHFIESFFRFFSIVIL